jgi:undecaprenyl-diphosphatase
MDIVKAIILAVIEGITEFLPISSTGHMIIGSSLMGIASDPFTKMFTVAIQLGAILSVLVLYWRRFLQSFDFYIKLFVAFLPAALIGFLFNDQIDLLLERVDVVAYMLIAGGIFFLFMDSMFRKNEESDKSINYATGFRIGLFQIIAMVPGVSRSAATIVGGMAQGLNKKTAAEFSFFLAVPTMLAATVYKMYKYISDGGVFGSAEILMLSVGNGVAFIVAMLAIRSFIQFLTRHGFKVFGYYRIILGVLILILLYSGVELAIV